MLDPSQEQTVAIITEIAKASFVPTVQDVIGLFGGDSLRERRLRNQKKLQARTAELLEERKVEPGKTEAAPRDVIDIVAAAQDTNSDEMLDLWARLLAAAADPSQSLTSRHDFIDTLKQMSPIDAAVFKAMPATSTVTTGDHRANQLARKLAVNNDTIVVSLDRLMELGLVRNPQANPNFTFAGPNPLVTHRGRELYRALFPGAGIDT